METINALDFTDFGTLVVTFLLISGIVFLRFLLVSGAYHFLFRILFRKRLRHRTLQLKPIERKQIVRELKLGFYSAWIFGGIGIATLWLWQIGFLRIYEPISAFPIWYVPLSILVFLFLHDTYYYFLHRWMHHSKWLWKIHLAHHKSTTTSVLTAFSFHPWEAFLQAVFLPLFLMVVPMSVVGLFVILAIMTISATINHAGVEIYPNQPWNSFIYKWLIGATHHDLHHKYVKKNYGLYFRFWDRVLGTEK